MNAPVRLSRRTVIVLAMILTSLVGIAPSLATAATVNVYMTRGDRLQIVQRPMPSGADRELYAARILTKGPTAAERKDGIGTSIPRGTVVQSVTVRDRVAEVRVSPTFATGGDGAAVQLRLAQVVYTMLVNKNVAAVRILVGDEPSPGPAADPDGLLDHSTVPRFEIIGPVPVDARQVQQRLAQLRYLPAGYVNGRIDYRTSQALLAFQGWEGLSRTGAATLDTRRALNRARVPAARRLTAGRRLEVSRNKGVVLLIENKQVKRAVHVSTGAGGRTPAGNFSVYRKERMSWSNPFSVWLPWASYIVGGIAFHQYPEVPSYPASHGCIRVGRPEARMLYEFASFGTPVSVV